MGTKKNCVSFSTSQIKYHRTGSNCENLIIANWVFSRVYKLLIHKVILLIAHLLCAICADTII